MKNKIKQIKGKIKRPGVQKRTLKALGLKRINDVVIHEDNPSIRGMINRVSGMVEVEEIDGN